MNSRTSEQTSNNNELGEDRMVGYIPDIDICNETEDTKSKVCIKCIQEQQIKLANYILFTTDDDIKSFLGNSAYRTDYHLHVKQNEGDEGEESIALKGFYDMSLTREDDKMRGDIGYYCMSESNTIPVTHTLLDYGCNNTISE